MSVSRPSVRPIAGAVLLSVLACAGDPPVAPDRDAGTLVLNLSERVSGVPLSTGARIHENAAGNRYAVDRFRYYVSNLRLEAESGEGLVVETVHYRDSADPSSAEWVVDVVPGGAYTAITVVFGLDEDANQPGALPKTPQNAAMAWPQELGGGYHYAWLEGRWVDGVGRGSALEVRTGRLGSGEGAIHHHVRVPLPGTVTIDGGTRTLDLTLDVNAWFDDPVYDFAEHADMTGDAAAQAELKANALDLFEPFSPALHPVSFVFPGHDPSTMPEPPDNPTTREGIQLGRLLFYDPVLSGDSTLACAGCHRQSHAFGDPRRFSVGIGGEQTGRHAQTIVNPGWIRRPFWDGRVLSLEEQALKPVESPIEMNADWDDVVGRIASHASYPSFFARVFGPVPITRDLVVRAIAQFERSLISRSSRYDRWITGTATFTPQEERGWARFHTEDAECFHCHHPSELLTNNLFHNIGLDSMFVDEGRGAVTGNPNERGQFRTPTLRNVGVSAPYMHDGRFDTLEEVLEHYRMGGHAGTPTVDPLIRTNVGLPLTDPDVADIIAFLHTLTDDAFLTNPDHANPFE